MTILDHRLSIVLGISARLEMLAPEERRPIVEAAMHLLAGLPQKEQPSEQPKPGVVINIVGPVDTN
jgi:hypothetical protein